jgi:hypothetical protein
VNGCMWKILARIQWRLPAILMGSKQMCSNTFFVRKGTRRSLIIPYLKTLIQQHFAYIKEGVWG